MMFTITAIDSKSAFETIAEIQEVFEERTCGKCNSENIRFDVREEGGNTFYKLTCLACRAQLDFGQRKDKQKGLFIRRKTADNVVMPNNGWYIYEGSHGR